MIDKYFLDGKWIVTYQRNKYSEIYTLYSGKSEKMAQKIYDNFIEKWR